MAKMGRFVTDPKAGAYCRITLDSGDRILVSHDKGGFGGGSVTIQEVRWWGFASGETLFACDLESAEGRRLRAASSRARPRAVLAQRPSGPWSSMSSVAGR
jgi:hypothetical protein